MNSSTLRRLISDHAALHTSELPPHYFFSLSDNASIPDDLTQLTILLTGPQGTPYSQGLWKLHLKIPEDYPKTPPKASFRTRIWHPNVEESTGSICVDTLKRDWESKLTLRHVLVTISCLLIQPNPDSALNSTAGRLLQDDYEAFARQAKLMTSIHARVPSHLKEAALEAKRRGEEAGADIREEKSQRPSMHSKTTSTSSIVMKKRPLLTLSYTVNAPTTPSAHISHPTDHNTENSDTEEDEASASKENDPSLSPTRVEPQPSPKRPTLTKGPLSDLPTPTEPDEDTIESHDGTSMNPSEQNIVNNALAHPASPPRNLERPRKSPKLVERSRSVNFSGARPQGGNADGQLIIPFEDGTSDDAPPAKRVCSGEGKENLVEDVDLKTERIEPLAKPIGVSGVPVKVVIPIKGITAGSVRGVKPRTGLRRL